MLLDCFNVVLSSNKEYPLLGTISKGDKKKKNSTLLITWLENTPYLFFKNMCYYMCYDRLLCPSEYTIDLAQMQVSPVLQPPTPSKCYIKGQQRALHKAIAVLQETD